MRTLTTRGVDDVCAHRGRRRARAIIRVGGEGALQHIAWLPRRRTGTGKTGLKELQGMEKGSSANMDNALAFVPSGANLLEAVRGDLTGNGFQDQLLVIDQPPPEGLLPGEHGPNRVLLLLLGDATGRWQLAARNDKLVPCSTRGGIAGDPFAYIAIEDGAFSVITNGGSRERWSSVYTFRYAPAEQTCWVHGVQRRVVDTETEATHTREFSAAELGRVRFEDFDPSILADVSLP